MVEQKIIRGSDAVIDIGRKIFPGFNLDDLERKRHYQELFYLLTGNDQVLNLGLKKGKSVLLLGDIGVGKTIMMKVMQILFKDSDRKFKWVNCLDFKDMLEDGLKPSEIKMMYGKNLKQDLYIDDLGLGQADHRSYGNVTNIIAEIIFERDELYVMENFLTHFSSNVPTTVPADQPGDKKSIERLYGDRALDRIKQMANVIVWQGKSLRGK